MLVTRHVKITCLVCFQVALSAICMWRLHSLQTHHSTVDLQALNFVLPLHTIFIMMVIVCQRTLP